MDDIVKAAMAKWPNVPDCHGWLALDARGDWYMRDDRIQAEGPFPNPKGSRILHEKLLDFIGRNYQGDAQGRWFFQNGPQRVFVTLEATPWVWRLGPAGDAAQGPMLITHTGVAAGPAQATLLDAQGRLYASTALGVGLVHSLDMAQAADAVEHGLWRPEAVAVESLERRFGFRRDPALALAD